MTKNFIPIIMFIVTIGCQTTVNTFQTSDPDKIGIQSGDYNGTIFKAGYPNAKLYLPDTISIIRFTPTRDNIEQAEKILKHFITRRDSAGSGQFDRRVYIAKNLKKYFRQYVGFINSKTDTIIHVNCYWNEYSPINKLKGYDDNRISYSSDYAIVLNGGNQYWNLNVNLTRHSVERFEINGY